MSRTSVLAWVWIAMAACSSASSEPAAPPSAHAAPASSPAAAPASARLAPPAPKAADDPTATSDYVPAEFKAGQARWKDTGVYVDGKPVGFLTFGELPIALKPTWIKDKVSAEKRPGTNDPAWRWVQSRFYKFNDYLRAIGIEPRTVRQIVVMGPKESDSTVATGRDLMSAKGQEFMFRFGGETWGKAIPHSADEFGNDRTPDKIAAVMIYIKKTPPTLVPNDGFYLDGREVNGVPYYGEPLRGGVRVYLDDKLATIIKRQDLDMKAVKDLPAGPSWSLYDFLHARGVDTSKIVEGWAIANDRRTDRIPAAQLATMMFSATAQAKGVVKLGPTQITANVIALHTRHVADDELPIITPDEQ